MTGIVAPFYGPAGDVVGAVAIADLAVDGGGTFAAYRLASDGDIDTNGGSGFADVGDWLSPKSGMDQYEVRATLVSGHLNTSASFSDPTSTWLNLGVSRRWQCRTATVGDIDVELTIEIRRVGGAVVDSATVTLTGTSGL